jgi:ferric-dicitrate binding protein FerR (iron transport regulator)
MEETQLKDLIDRYLSDQCNKSDIETLRQLLEDPKCVDQLEQLMDQQLRENTASANEYPGVVGRLKSVMSNKIQGTDPIKKSPVVFLKRSWIAAAAIVIVVLGIGIVWMMKKNTHSVDNVVVTPSKTEIVPGKDGAILTLADGRTIVLDSAGNGLIATQSGSEIVLSDGQVIYKPGNDADVVYNTMSTPKGRQFRLVLPDGTKAWLNAASSLRYPTAFSGKERNVEVSGEVYFEVSKNPKMPFKVKVNEDVEVTVLGTHFNINSYSNEASINTTLLEGSVQISSKGQKEILKPGQQAQINADQKMKVVNDVNLKKVMAWKDGVFDFDDAKLQEVMRQLERWYDIEVVYEKGVPDMEFVGTLGRDLSLEDVLKGLKLSEVNFRVEGRKLIVMP